MLATSVVMAAAATSAAIRQRGDGRGSDQRRYPPPH
jgi:hypothetical protein